MSAEIQFKQGKTPLGYLLIAAQAGELVYAEFGETPGSLLSQFRHNYPDSNDRPSVDSFLERAWSAYENFLQEPEALYQIAVRVQGSEFQQQVWSALLRMPTGTRQTYTSLAQSIGQPTAVRAVASACARNSIALRIPCHRILRSDGALGGYRWGLALKQRLLNAERRFNEARRAQSSEATEAVVD
ncbi:MAG TPA: methylated-DNA--[protein]-cysteine S-methyltransferase [Marinobacterium sp.]|nr:methylated-DNA--[protein]-cysteine S-methyltransferase [Marinobacterium sp.]